MWNYRVIKWINDDGISHYAIHEVYYDKNGDIEYYTANAVEPYGETLEELKDDLNKFRLALTKSVLEYNDLPHNRIPENE